MILLWGLAADPPLASVRAALSRIGTPVVFLDQQAVLQCKLELAFEGALCGALRMSRNTIDLASISAVYVRPYDVRQVQALEGRQSGDSAFDRALRFEDALNCWLDMTPALVINRPSAMASNNSKPYQMELIRAAGFAVPDTLLTTDVSAVRAFWERHDTVIYKSISGIRSIVTRLRKEHRERLPDVSHCPTQFQQYIDGTDIRVHVVGDEIFGCEIFSDADDYRYPAREGTSIQVRRYSVPDDLADRCRRLAAALELPVTGVDLRRTPAGRIYCFEANPSPGFSFYEEATGQPVGAAIARLLANAAHAEP
jgi:glutathione synthase/RimK-type ligase-like ATP-grasp enzyme